MLPFGSPALGTSLATSLLASASRILFSAARHSRQHASASTSGRVPSCLLSTRVVTSGHWPVHSCSFSSQPVTQASKAVASDSTAVPERAQGAGSSIPEADAQRGSEQPGSNGTQAQAGALGGMGVMSFFAKRIMLILGGKKVCGGWYACMRSRTDSVMLGLCQWHCHDPWTAFCYVCYSTAVLAYGAGIVLHHMRSAANECTLRKPLSLRTPLAVQQPDNMTRKTRFPGDWRPHHCRVKEVPFPSRVAFRDGHYRRCLSSHALSDPIHLAQKVKLRMRLLKCACCNVRHHCGSASWRHLSPGLQWVQLLEAMIL